MRRNLLFLLAVICLLLVSQAVFADDTIVFTHPGVYEYALGEYSTSNPPAPADGFDYVTWKGNQYIYKQMYGQFFHTYQICMDWLGRDDVCRGYERCFHKEGYFAQDWWPIDYLK